jgi:integrase
LIANGENLKYISEQRGHGAIKATADTYGHLIPGGNKAAVEKLDGNREKTGKIETVKS